MSPLLEITWQPSRPASSRELPSEDPTLSM